ncbi:MAG: M20/M25/M40 family metallo-hydrolase [Actinobacteria bacterium]|nr:M20/M25/M40 family metallo-hydrolase [Actinomycetota bacterium]
MTTIPAAEVTGLLVALIRNRCVNDGTPDSGHEHRSVETIESYLGRRGRRFEPHPGRQSVLYRIPGTCSDAPSLMLLGHTDVVPVTAAGWSVDPFEGRRSNGFVWGRGAVDMLNQTASMAAVFRRFLNGEVPPPTGDLLFLAVADEEAGGKLGAAYLAEHHWDEVGCDYVLTEIGAPMLAGTAGPALPVTVAEKGPHWRTFRVRGIPGHGSQPYGTRNALVPLAEAITRLAEVPAPILISDEWRAFVAAWEPEPELAADLVDPERVDAAVDRIAESDPGFARWVHACTHLTISPNTLHAGVKANVVPDEAVAEIDVRMLPGQETADLLDHFRKVIGPDVEDLLEITEIESTLANGSPPEGPLWDAIGDSLAETAGHRRLLPTLIPVATDARFFRRRGTIAYGMAVFDDQVGFGDLLSMFHGHDERVSEASLGLTAAHLLATVRRFFELTSP